ncbi:DAHP synthetase [Catenaria anguillulae PL171]|uniref:Phospho-2-dehydro-3-deoxyheptonate aldolase n=1 Tax=Catenaria anguillulae PL171 TaxID=765915 RepID=A0A1Y2HC68_9FUNG|nr:DAHP synthetase [Catenaria anguillulae PL171]
MDSPMPASSAPGTPKVAHVPDGWTPDSWTTKPRVQDVEYEDTQHLDKVLRKLRHLPPLVSPQEIDTLRSHLKEVAEGKRFLLQGGDCAECTPRPSLAFLCACVGNPVLTLTPLRVLLQMSLVLTWGARTPVVRVARMAGQYAKPRSKPTEMVDGKEIFSFRGDNVNGFDPAERKPDPERLVGAYFHSAATLNYVRTLLASGFADLHHPSTWDLNHVKKHEVRQDYQAIVNRLTDALDYMKTIGVDSENNGGLKTVEMYMSHEGLMLEYESTQTRLCPMPGASSSSSSSSKDKVHAYYNVGTHFLWIGDRTRQLNGAHLEYFRGIRNPIGIKVGPSMQPDELVRVLALVNPDNEPGKVTLITRYGADKVKDHLPGHIAAVQKAGHCVVWCSDPMHGNTVSAPSGHKTRGFDRIVHELSESLRIHKSLGSRLGGVHLELTGDRVTECVGGSMELMATDLPSNYQTQCDPRLNYEQSLDVAFLVAKYYERERSGVVQL